MGKDPISMEIKLVTVRRSADGKPLMNSHIP
jgi:hypothetical protein